MASIVRSIPIFKVNTVSLPNEDNVGKKPVCYMLTAKAQMRAGIHLCGSNLDIACLSEYTTIFIDSVSGQRRP